MAQNNNDEIDLGAVIDIFKGAFKKLAIQVFRTIRFLFKNWIVVSILIVLGVGYGIYSGSKTKPNKEAKALIRINFDAVKYVYDEIDLLNNKFMVGDTIFLKNAGFRTDSLEVKKLELIPNVSMKDIAEGEKNNQSLIALLKNFDLSDEDLQLSDAFTREYKFHTLELKLSHYGTKETIEKIIQYINSNKILGEIRTATVENLKNKIADNEKIIKQIDDVIETFRSGESLKSPSNQLFVVDKNYNISEVFTSKVVMQQQIAKLRNVLIFSKDIVVLINEPHLIEVNKGLLGKKPILYPLLLVFAFLFLTFLKNSYFYLKEMENKTED